MLKMYFTYIYIHFLVGYARCMLYSKQPTVLLARRHLSIMLLTNFGNLNFISVISQETHNLSFDRPTNYLFLFTTERHFRYQGNVLHPTSKWVKCDLVWTLNTFRNPFLRVFLSGRHLSFQIFYFILLIFKWRIMW